MAISQPPFQSTLVDADDRVQTPWAQWFSQLQPILQSVVASGPTSGRPTQNLFIGYPYFDTTIDQMVYWNGVIWVTYAPSTTGTSILKGNGTGGFNNAIAGIDFAPATSGNAILYGNGAGGFSSVAIGSGVTFAGGVLSATGSGGTVTSVSGTAPIASSGGTTPAISISQAGISTNGYLSSADWNIFNAKGSVTSVSGTGSVNGITLTGTVTSSGSLTLGGTLGGIGNSQLTNSSITINGSTVSLGGSTTVTATATNALTIGTGLSGTSYDGSTAVTIANTGVLSITGTALQITASASTGAVTLSLPSTINVNTTGYAAGLAGGGANYVPYQTAVNTTGFVSPGVVGQVFTSTGAGSAPNWQNATSPPGSPGYYGAWHDTSTVTATSTATAYVMAIGSIDLENGTSIVGGTKITVANTAVYNLQFSAQLSNPNAQIADVSIWIRLNGVNVTDGAGTNGVPAKHGSNNGLQIISWNYVLNLTAGDYIELVWHSDTTGVQLITFPATTSPAVPESPSLIVTIQAVTQIGIGYQGLTSATSVLIATGSKVFTTNFTNSQTAFTIGTRVRVAYSSTPANFMEGVVTAFSGTTFTVLVDSIGGSGTFVSWTISVAGIQGSNGVTSITGTANQVIASASTGAVTLSLPQNINSGATPTFTGTNFTGIPNAGLTNSAITINGTATSLGGSISVGTVTGVTGTAPVVSSGGTAPAISMAAATTSVSGYLTSTDWTTFNNKSNTNGTVTSVAAITLGTTGTDLSSTVATGTTTPVITLQVPTASAANRGALSSTDWTTFNNKQPAGAYLTASTGVTSFSGNSTGLTPATATTGAITLAGILVGANGGTGVANTGKTFTIGGNFTTSGAFTTTLTVTANTSLTLPISGTVLSSVTAPAANPITGTPSASNYLRGDGTWATFTTGTVTSVGFTGGLITVATPTTTPAFTVAGTSGGIPYFSSASTWATSAALALNSLVIGGGAGAAPVTTTTGTGVLTALGTNVGSAGAFVTFNGALGTPSSGTVTNLTGTASININGTVGATTATTGKFTTLEYTSTLTGGTGIVAIGTNQIYKDASGNVGIGTSSPTVKLQIGDGTGVNNAQTLRFFSGNPTANIGETGTLLFSSLVGGGSSNQVVAAIKGYMQYAANSNALGFYVGAWNNSATLPASPNMVIDSSGNVGIGTSSPTGKLDVAGTIKTLGYTVATLPTGVVGARAYVTNALAPTFGATVVTGGAVTIPVFYNGTNWIVG